MKTFEVLGFYPSFAQGISFEILNFHKVAKEFAIQLHV